MGSNEFVTLFFLVAAVLIFLQLRNVLGRRTGSEKPPFDSYSQRDLAKGPGSEDGKVVTLPKRAPEAAENSFANIDAYTPAGTELNGSLRELAAADPNFSPKEFLNGSRMAYEMIVMAFADGDRKTLKGLLSQDVYEGFESAITDRETKGETIKSTFVGIEKADIIHASIKDSEAHVTVRIICELISATYDKSGTLVEGDADNVAEVNDIWTFARDLRSRDPNWKLIATESEQ
ncbi:Tim44/TimA family putative adaptor protein [Agrobacterium sp. ES01]|uniref:Tim44/TimA family putative adaptor protein n=1 Tax=Agrobacterium sp. ES01 TaxID=3420714 RepID=UPI003D099EE5